MDVSPHAGSGVENQGSLLPRRSQAALCDRDEMRLNEKVQQVTCVTKAVCNIQSQGKYSQKEGTLKLQVLTKKVVKGGIEVCGKCFDLTFTAIM